MSIWRVRLTTETTQAQAYADALEEMTPSVSWMDGDEDGIVEVEAIFEEGEPDHHDVLQRLTKVARNALPDVIIEPLPDQDWLSLSYQSFPPKSVGRFWIYGSHVTEAPPHDSWPLRIDAATAFGSGEHPTTAGCLAAIEKMSHNHALKNVLDMGTGSGILAIAAVRAFKARVTAIDIDPESIRLTEVHARDNGVIDGIALEAGDGFNTPLVSQRAPYDMLIANILAGPLCEMAKAGAAVVAPGGYIILAGLLETQAEMVLAAWREQGCLLVERETRGEWTILTLQKLNA